MNDTLEKVQDLGRRLGELVAEGIALDIDPGRAEHLLLMRMLSQAVRERFPVGENTRADAVVEQFATLLRSQWRQVPKAPIDIAELTSTSPDHDLADLTDQRVRIANEFLKRLSKTERAQILSRLHFCSSCGADVRHGCRFDADRCFHCGAPR